MKKKIIYYKCEKQKKSNDFLKYTIPEGEHYADRHKRIETDNYKFQVHFDNSAIYTLPDADQHDINKLTGFSDNRSHHQRFSARFGWRYSDDELRLFAYVYNDGLWVEEEISIIKMNETYTCGIFVDKDQYIFYIEELEKDVSMPRAATTAKGQGYRLYPYFGGNNVAPHDIKIWLKYL